MHPNLSFEQAPPISAPYRFFVTAPWFGVAAGLLLAWSGDEALASRWTPSALAATHLLVAGFMLQAMCGALLQFVPVAAGGNIWRPGRVAAWVHPLLAVGAVCLATAFVSASGTFFMLASAAFALAISGYAAIVGLALWRTSAQGPSLRALRLAVLGLAVTVALGVTLAMGFGTGHILPVIEIIQVHAAWGLGGWALMLLMAVSYLVVPMFQLTPPYPARVAAGLPVVLLVLLGLWSWQWFGRPAWMDGVWLGGMLLASVYAVVTLTLQRRRRRKVADPTFYFFAGAMVALLVMAAVGISFDFDAGADPRMAVWFGVLAIPGVFISAISGMLYKIVPFLNWLHLQRLCPPGVLPPSMREMIPERAMLGHLWLHFAAVIALLAAVALPVLTRPAGLLFAASCAWLGVNVARGVRAYLRFRRRMVAAAVPA
jgi:hypothetical protein